MPLLKTICVVNLTLAFALGFASASGTMDKSGFSGGLPVPREKALVVETDVSYEILGKANPLFPAGDGVQWGSGWHNVANEWDWYENYATGERILWRTTGWEYSPDYMHLTWHVRRGVTWNDGVPYTSQDILYTFQLWMKDPSLGGAGSAENVAAVSAPDDYTVVFDLKRADYRFHQNLRMWGGGNIVAKHIYEKQDPRTFPNWPPVETGPYKLKGWYPDHGMYVWQADPNYWATRVMGKKPGPLYVVFRSAPPPDLDLLEFVQGNVDMPLAHIFTVDMLRAAENRWTHTVRAPYMDVVSTGIGGFNTARAPTSDRAFRWAMQLLLNRQKLQKLYPDADSTALTVWPWPAYASLKKWEVPAIEAKYGPMLRYDPAEAAKQLDTAGYLTGSDGLRRTPDGKPIRLVLVSGPSPSFDYLVAADFSDELRKVGIDNVLKTFGAGFTEQQAAEGQFDISFGVLDGSASWSSDPFPMIDAYSGRWAKPIGVIQVQGDWSKTRLNDPVLDAVGEKMARMSPDDPAYLGLVGQALDRWYYDLPAVPALEKTFAVTMSDKYWINWPVPGRMYQVPYSWWPTLFFILFEIKPAK